MPRACALILLAGVALASLSRRPRPVLVCGYPISRTVH